MDKLFISNFNDILFNDTYHWDNIKNILSADIKIACEENKIDIFYKVLLQLSYYVNMLIYKNKIFPDAFYYLNNILSKEKIINLCIKNKQLDLLHPFLKGFISSNNNSENYEKYIKLIKKIEDTNLIKNTSYKKILNTIIYRDIYSKMTGSDTFHNFYFNSIESEYNFDNFIKNIQKHPTIINIKYDNVDIKNIKLIKIINKIFYEKEYNISYENKNIVIRKHNYDGKIVFVKDKFNIIIQTQFDLDVLLHNHKNLKEKYMRNNKNIIYIKYSTNDIPDDLSLLELINKIVTAKYKLSYFAQNISDLLYYKDTTYLADVFKFYIKLTKNKHFVLQIFKFFYIYSYYDYFFYYDNELVHMLRNGEKKGEMFNEFCEHLKRIFKFPKEMYKYPPFYDNDSIIGYEFNYPNYIKLYHLTNAINPRHKNNLYDTIINYLDIKPNKTNLLKQVIPEETEEELNQKSKSDEYNVDLQPNIYQEIHNDDTKQFIFNTDLK